MPKNTLRDPCCPPEDDCEHCGGTGYRPSLNGGVHPCACGELCIRVDMADILNMPDWSAVDREIVAKRLLMLMADAEEMGFSRKFIDELEDVRKITLSGVTEDDGA